MIRSLCIELIAKEFSRKLLLARALSSLVREIWYFRMLCFNNLVWTSVTLSLSISVKILTYDQFTERFSLV